MGTVTGFNEDYFISTCAENVLFCWFLKTIILISARAENGYTARYKYTEECTLSAKVEFKNFILKFYKHYALSVQVVESAVLSN